MPKMPLRARLTLAYRALKEGSWYISDDGVTVAFGAQTDASGVAVSELTAMQSAAVYACVRLLSETVASCPLYLYERQENGGRQRAEGHPSFELMSVSPNPRMSPMTWEQVCMNHVTLWGNHYSWIVRDGAMRPVELVPLNPASVQPDFEDSSGRNVVYRVEPGPGEDRVPRVIPSSEMFHVSGLSRNGLEGLSVIGQNRDAIGLDLAQRKYGVSFFGAGTRPGGWIMSETALDRKAKSAILESMEARHQGPRGWNRVGILDGNLKWVDVSMKPEDAQFVEQMQYSTEQIARIYGVPLTLLQSPEKGANYGGGIEQLTIQFNTYTIRPYNVKIEQEANRKLLSREERGRYFFEHNQDALLRGDVKARWEAYEKARMIGAASINYVLRKENLPPIAEAWADAHMVPANMIDAKNLGQIGVGDKQAANSEPEKMRASLLRPVLLRDLRVLFERERKALRTAIESRSAEEFVEWLPSYYKSFESFASDHCRDTIEAVGKASRNGEAASWAESWCSRLATESQSHLESVLRESVDKSLDSRTALVLAIDQWERDKAESVCEAILSGSDRGRLLSLIGCVE